MDQSWEFCDANVDFDDVVNAVKRAGGKAEERVNQKDLALLINIYCRLYVCSLSSFPRRMDAHAGREPNRLSKLA